MPGRTKICSRMTEPPIRMGSCRSTSSAMVRVMRIVVPDTEMKVTATPRPA